MKMKDVLFELYKYYVDKESEIRQGRVRTSSSKILKGKLSLTDTTDERVTLNYTPDCEEDSVFFVNLLYNPRSRSIFKFHCVLLDTPEHNGPGYALIQTLRDISAGCEDYQQRRKSFVAETGAKIKDAAVIAVAKVL